MKKAQLPREGDLYKVIDVEKNTFKIYYGYYEENERCKVEPLPVFPDLKENPVYTARGYSIVTAIQQPCKHYSPRNKERSEEWCGDCIYYLNGTDEISICGCKERRLEQKPDTIIKHSHNLNELIRRQSK